MTDTTFDVPALAATGPSPKMSGRYQFYSTRDLIQPLLEDRWEITKAYQAKPRKGPVTPHAKHLVRITHPSLKLGDDRLELIIRNSHDGSSKFDMMAGAWRFICENGIVIGTSFDSVTITHLAAFEVVQARAQAMIERAPEVAQVFDAWKTRQTSDDERHAFAVAAAFVRWGEEAPVNPRDLLEVRRHEDSGNDLWTVFNRLQENVMRGGAATLTNARRHVRGIKAIDETIRVNRGLWRAGEALYGAASDIALVS
jgi:Domain of unknown function (DUF932)